MLVSHLRYIILPPNLKERVCHGTGYGEGKIGQIGMPAPAGYRNPKKVGNMTSEVAYITSG
jgi:hypothetical protein